MNYEADGKRSMGLETPFSNGQFSTHQNRLKLRAAGQHLP
jgi:hypothetical protein